MHSLSSYMGKPNTFRAEPELCRIEKGRTHNGGTIHEFHRVGCVLDTFSSRWRAAYVMGEDLSDYIDGCAKLYIKATPGVFTVAYV